MRLIPIQVQCYAGYKADQEPRQFFWENQWIDVVEIWDRWYQEYSDPEWPMANYFRVTSPAGQTYLLKHDREPDDWYLVCR